MNRRFCSAQRVRQVAPGTLGNATSGVEIVGDVAGARDSRFILAETLPESRADLPRLQQLAQNFVW